MFSSPEQLGLFFYIKYSFKIYYKLSLLVIGKKAKSFFVLQAWARLCKCLGQDFLPYMNVVMPPLLHSAQLKPDVTITSADSDADIDESDDDRFVALKVLNMDVDLLKLISLF